MTGLGRILRRRAGAPAADTDAAPGGVPEVQPVPAEDAPSHDGQTARLEPVAVAPQAVAAEEPERPSTFRRSRARRRMRFLRRAREILLRDLGGLVYEVHRSAGAGDRARHEALVAGKVERLRLLDAELLELGSALGDVRGEFVVRQPGVGGACRACGELHGSDARFCSRCGARLDGSGAAPRAAEGATTGDAAGRDGGARGSEAREDRGVPRDRAADDATPNRAIERDAPPDDASGTAPDRAPGDEAPSQGAGDAPDSENRRAYPVASTPEERR